MEDLKTLFDQMTQNPAVRCNRCGRVSKGLIFCATCGLPFFDIDKEDDRFDKEHEE